MRQFFHHRVFACWQSIFRNGSLPGFRCAGGGPPSGENRRDTAPASHAVQETAPKRSSIVVRPEHGATNPHALDVANVVVISGKSSRRRAVARYLPCFPLNCIAKPSDRMVGAHGMNPLDELLSFRVKAELFRLFLVMNLTPLHLHELERQSRPAVGTVRQKLRKLICWKPSP